MNPIEQQLDKTAKLIYDDYKKGIRELPCPNIKLECGWKTHDIINKLIDERFMIGEFKIELEKNSIKLYAL